MIKVHTKRFARSWLYVAAAGLVVAYLGYHTYETQLGAQAPAGQQADAFGSLFHREASTGSANKVVNEAASASVLGAHSAHDEEQASTAHDTGMEDWKKPENADLHAELQRWYDHREESSLAQRRADASALMAKVEAQQAAGKIGQTSAALAKLMLLQGAPSDDPQHAVQLQQVMAQLAGQLSFGE